MPLNVRIGSADLPLPAIAGAVISGLAWISVFALHHNAVYVGGGWMLFGLVFYVIYRRYVEGTPLTRRVQVPEISLKKQPAEVEYSTILVPIFGTKLDDDIVSTAGRLADAEVEKGERPRGWTSSTSRSCRSRCRSTRRCRRGGAGARRPGARARP